MYPYRGTLLSVTRGTALYVLIDVISAKKLVGRCYRLEMTQSGVFTRAMMLFGLHNTVTDDDDGVGQQLM